MTNGGGEGRGYCGLMPKIPAHATKTFCKCVRHWHSNDRNKSRESLVLYYIPHYKCINVFVYINYTRAAERCAIISAGVRAHRVCVAPNGYYVWRKINTRELIVVHVRLVSTILPIFVSFDRHETELTDSYSLNTRKS